MSRQVLKKTQGIKNKKVAAIKLPLFYLLE
jgi:hypothetical protein